jgi:Domain of unknown function (DUF4397)
MQTKFVFTNKSGVLLMRLSRFVLLCVAAAALGACDSKTGVTTPTLPPLSYARFINAVTDTGGLDVRAMDQVEFSPVANNLTFRTATAYFQTEAGVRHLRIFPTSTNINVTSNVMADALITLPANSRFTLLLAGSARAGTVQLWVIDDNAPAPAAGQIGVRLVNASGGVVDGYVLATATTPLSGTPTFSGLGLFIQSNYLARSTGAVAIRVTDAGTSSVRASLAAPASPATLTGANPGAGRSSEGTVLSAYDFGAGAAGSANAAVTSPSLVWFVDRNPCDNPPAAGCGQ